MKNKKTKFIFVTGGVISGLGKGISAASIANLLKARGFKVNLQKCDPYLNVDAGLLNPREHGECFVTKDGAETDLDLGHYERFIDQELTQSSSLMAGKILLKLIQDERAGKFDGDDVQIIPHLTSAIQKYIHDAGEGFDIHIVEIGGTVGDYESLSFIEAIREFGVKYGLENCLYIHVVYLPFINTSKETKTKPAQNAVRDLRGLGIQANILICRSEEEVKNKRVVEKIHWLTGIDEDKIVIIPNEKSIYEIPLKIEKTGLGNAIVKNLGLKNQKPDLAIWEEMIKKTLKNNNKKLKVALIAKYLDNMDTYLSVIEALKSAATWNDVDLNICWIDAKKIENYRYKVDKLKDFDGIVIPGGFGKNGLEGKIAVAEYCFKEDKPYLGLCLGLQMGIVAVARLNGLKQATSFEIDPDSDYKVIDTMKGQEDKTQTGGTMRLGNYECDLAEGSLARKLYKKKVIEERHRHRGECNPKYIKYFDKWGLRVTGVNPKTNLTEIVEGVDKRFFVGVQFHPEFKSRPTRPHPLFEGFIKAMKNN